MKKNDGYKKIKSLFYIVAIISMIIAIVGKVRAEVYSNIITEMNTDLGDMFISDTAKTEINNYVSNYDYCFKINVNNNNGDWGYFFYNDSDYNFKFYLRNSDTNLYELYFNNYAVITYGLKNNVNFYGLYKRGDSLYSVLFTASGNRSYSNNRYGYNFNKSNPLSNVGTESRSYFPYNTSNFEFSIKSMINFYCYNNSGGSYQNLVYFEPLLSFPNTELYEEPQYYDDNFIIYKSYGVGGISDPLLNIQYTDNIFSQGYTYTSSTTYSLTFDVDGTETTVSISSSAYPDDFFENGSFRTSFDLIYRMLSNKIVNFSSADTVTLTAVSMSATAYPTSDMQGTPETVAKSTLCNLVLKGSEGGEDIESDTIPAVSDVTIVYDQVSNSGDFYNHSGTWHNDVTIPDWAECYTIVIHGNYFPSGFNLDFSYDWLVDHQTFSKFQFLGYVDPTYINIQNAQVDYYDNLEFHKTDIIECIKFLGLLNSCDVVRIIVGDTDITGNTWTTVQDNIFFMSSYYQKLSIKGLGNIQSAVESGTYYTKALYWYTKDRLDNMSGYLADYTKKSLSNQTVQNGYLQSINTNIISIKDSIDSGINSIVSAISGISGGSSYSLPSLSTELQRLFIPSLTWESIDFNDYMDSLGVLKIPFEMTNDVLDVTKASYSSTLDLHINDFEIDVTGNNDKLTVFEDQDYSFNPRSIFSNQAWTMLTYLNAFAVILAESWFTYCHIFRREKADDR